jgi:hypothetical protein
MNQIEREAGRTEDLNAPAAQMCGQRATILREPVD